MGLLDGKVAVVTGGGTGIGRAVSLDLARAGAKVVVNDYGVSVDGRDPSSEPANEVVAAIRSAGGQAVASPESVATMAGGRARRVTAVDADAVVIDDDGGSGRRQAERHRTADSASRSRHRRNLPVEQSHLVLP